MAHCGGCPDTDRNGITNFRSYLVDEGAGDKKTERVSQREDGNDAGELEFGHADSTDRVLENGLE
jgi:hypothetical protein